MKAERSELLEHDAQAGRRVLIVDDHPSFRSCVRALLMSEGFVVVGEAEDGESALALTAELSPDLVLLDIQLPDISGFEVVSRLHEKNPELEVVLISSRDQNAYGSSLGASGALGFITKGELSGPALARLLK
jgi:two-component system response regulator EvgA